METERLVGIGIAVVFIGLIIIFTGALAGKESSKTKVAVGGFIGFIPFGFGNDRKMVWLAVITSLAPFIIFMFFNYRMK